MIWTVLQIRISCNQDIIFRSGICRGGFFVHAVLFTSLPYLFDKKCLQNANYADKEKERMEYAMEKIKVLVVDDESRMRKLVSDFLTRDGYEVIEAGDGEEAVEIFSRIRILQ